MDYLKTELNEHIETVYISNGIMQHLTAYRYYLLPTDHCHHKLNYKLEDVFQSFHFIQLCQNDSFDQI